MRVGIVATLKSEAPYLLEWIAYHRVVGIRTFFIADNGGDDDTSRLLRRLHRAGIITRYDVIGRKAPQQTVYSEMIPEMHGIVELAAIIDGDEFVRPLEEARADAVIARYFVDPAISALALHWACYGSAGQIRRRRGLVTARFPSRADKSFWRNTHVKSVVRVDRFVSSHDPHFSNLAYGRFIDTSERDIAWKNVPGESTTCSWRGVRLDHFAVKSLEEFQTIRGRRGRGDLPLEHPLARHGAEYFGIMDRNEVRDPTPAWLVTRTRREMIRLRFQIAPAFRAARRIMGMRRTHGAMKLRPSGARATGHTEH